jgi:hypothetical protein
MIGNFFFKRNLGDLSLSYNNSESVQKQERQRTFLLSWTIHADSRKVKPVFDGIHLQFVGKRLLFSFKVV